MDYPDCLTNPIFYILVINTIVGIVMFVKLLTKK